MTIRHHPNTGTRTSLSEKLLKIRGQHRIRDPAPGRSQTAYTKLGRNVGRLSCNYLAAGIAGADLDSPIASRPAGCCRPLTAIVAGPGRVDGEQEDAESAYEKGSQ